MTAAWVTAGLVFGRISGLLLTLPVLSTVGLPRYVGVLLAVLLTLLIAPSVPLVEAPTLLHLTLGLAGELLLGASLGLIIRAAFASFTVAAELISRQTALGMSSFLDPVMSLGQSALGIVASWLAGMVFISTHQHLRVLETVAASFDRMPPGYLADVEILANTLAEGVRTMIVVGVQLSGPLIALVFLVNVFIGVLARLAPRMNVFFSVGMTLNSITGVWLFGIGLPWILQAHQGTVEAAIDTVIGLFLGGGLR